MGKGSGQQSDSCHVFAFDCAPAFDQLFRDVWSECGALPGRKFLVVDEPQEHVDPNTMPPGFWQIIDTGRWHWLDLAFTCQSLNRIHNGVRVQLTHVPAFNHADERAERGVRGAAGRGGKMHSAACWSRHASAA